MFLFDVLKLFWFLDILHIWYLDILHFYQQIFFNCILIDSKVGFLKDLSFENKKVRWRVRDQGNTKSKPSFYTLPRILELIATREWAHCCDRVSKISPAKYRIRLFILIL